MPAARFQLAKKVLEKNKSIFGHYSIITDSLQRSTIVFLVLRVQIPVFAPGHPILEQSKVTFRCLTRHFISRYPNTPTVSETGVEPGLCGSYLNLKKK